MWQENNYIARIISLEELKNYILPQGGERSTFHLRSAISYRDLPLENKGDLDEMRCEGKGFSANSGNNYLISCWSYLGEKDSPVELFKVYKERNDVAIVSTIGKVKGLLKKNIYDKYI